LRGKAALRFLVCLELSLNPLQQAEALANVERRLREILDQKRMDNVTFEVVLVDDLPLNPKTRKIQLIVAETATG